MARKGRLLPTGDCWCGCGTEVGLGSFFAPGHDKIAEAAVIHLKYGSIPQFLVDHGFGPGGQNPTAMLAAVRPDQKVKSS